MTTVAIDPDYVENHIRHFADDRVDVVTGPVYEWDADSNEWYVKWYDRLMMEGGTGPRSPAAFPSLGRITAFG